MELTDKLGSLTFETPKGWNHSTDYHAHCCRKI